MSDMDRGLLNATADAAIALDERVDKLEDPPKDPRQAAVDQGLPRDLLGTEQSVWQRLTPGRNPWPEIAEFDERVAELEIRQNEISAEIQRLVERKIAAPARDAERLGAWQLDGEQGPRPEPELPAIEAEIERLRADFEGLTHAVAQVLAEKTAYVTKHRTRLVREATERRDLDAREQVLGEIARALASQLDSACEAGTARGMSACPPLARRLAEVLDALVARGAEEAEEAVREAERAEWRERRRRDGRWVEIQNEGA